MIVLGLGSNIGDRLSFLRLAVRQLSPFITHLQCSPVYESPALLPVGAPAEWDIAYYNMAVRGETKLTPTELLQAVKQAEQAIGRQVRGHWGPREIDIDILVYGDTVMDTPELTLPHKGLLSRDFALVPLADIAPEFMLAGKPASELAKKFRAKLQKLEQSID